MLLIKFCLFAGLYYVVCSDTILVCPNKYDMYEGWCYRLFSETRANYDNAVTACEGQGGSLVSIHDAEVNTFLGGYKPDGFLIGLRYDAHDYYWSDESAVDFKSFGETFVTWREFFGYCAKLVNGKWENAECETDLLPFMCGRKPDEVILTPTDKCPEPTIYTDSGSLSSPGYPAYFSANPVLQCTYKLVAMDSIKLRFEDLSLTDGSSLVVANNWDSFDHPVAVLSGGGITYDFTVDSKFVMLQFNSRDTGRWSLDWQGVTKYNFTLGPRNVCPDAAQMYLDSGWIASPGYPQSYYGSPTMHCAYKLVAKNNYVIKLKFMETTLGADKIYVYKGLVKTSAALVYTITSSSAGKEVVIPSNQGLLYFDGQGQGAWMVSWVEQH